MSFDPEHNNGLPSAADVLDYLRDTGSASKNDLAKAFGLKGDDRAQLKRLLRDLEADGALVKDGKRLSPEASLPPVMVVKAEALDEEGQVLASPAEARSSGLPWPNQLKIRVRPNKNKNRQPGLGDRFLARIERIAELQYDCSVIKILPSTKVQPVVGCYERGRVEPTDRKDRNRFYKLEAKDCEGLEDGELVVILPEPAPNRFGPPLASLKQSLGPIGSVASISTIAIVERKIPTQFSEQALAEADKAKAPSLAGRADLRDLPLVTVDGADARDFDDAIFAESTAKGHRLVVAIADVSAYVTHQSALDRTARERGNSCYFPDQVVPMLPEALSNGWCSLVPNEERGCLAVEIEIDDEGKKLSHRFVRGLMRSHARLTYDQVEEVLEGEKEELNGNIVERIQCLNKAYEALEQARAKRGTLDLDVPERKAVLSDDRSAIVSIGFRERLTSNKIIEEFMVLANVCAAETLEDHETPCAYRIHDVPDPARIDSLRDMLRGLDVELAKGVALAPKDFNRLLIQVEESPHKDTINESILRAQSQAKYDTHNIGHFGLCLDRYAHFTSPIRRYSDLCVHRALIQVLRLGSGGNALPFGELQSICEAISYTERRAIDAERASMDRYLAAYHQKHIGEILTAKLVSVTKHGLFVRVASSGAEGLLPFSGLPDDRYEVDPIAQLCVGRDTSLRLGVGDILNVELVEAKPLQGGLLFALDEVLEQGVSAHQLRYGFKQVKERSRGLSKRRHPRGVPKGKKRRLR